MNTHFILADLTLATLSAPAIVGAKRERTDDGSAAVDAIEEIGVSADEEPMAEPLAKKAKQDEPIYIGSSDEEDEDEDEEEEPTVVYGGVNAAQEAQAPVDQGAEEFAQALAASQALAAQGAQALLDQDAQDLDQALAASQATADAQAPESAGAAMDAAEAAAPVADASASADTQEEKKEAERLRSAPLKPRRKSARKTKAKAGAAGAAGAIHKKN